ncbi:MAG TPA: hypothetical protein VFI86_03795 [Burkholderiales bacterium]|nr:hypothetical protein [Burkholderiales bacterium]
MRSRLAFAVIACLASRCAAAQDAYGAMQNLLAGLTNGTEVVLYSPLANGMLEVTRFKPPLALPQAEAEAAVAIAREHLRMLGIEVPTADQLTRALVGGTIETRDGPADLPATLPLTGPPPLVTTQVLLANSR